MDKRNPYYLLALSALSVPPPGWLPPAEDDPPEEASPLARDGDTPEREAIFIRAER